jgi:amino acid permease
VANLANAAIGAGVLALPDAFKLSGIVLGPLLCVFFAAALQVTRATPAAACA